MHVESCPRLAQRITCGCSDVHMSGSNKGRLAAIAAIGFVGVALTCLNLAGLLFSMRAAEVDGYRDFAGPTIGFEKVLAAFERLTSESPDNVTLVTEATRLVHVGMAHIPVRETASMGLDHYGMRVPLRENWLLHFLAIVRPGTYADYEFCNYRRALERGTGRCGQQALALNSFLAEQGLKTGFIALGGHVVATAEVEPSQWYILDPNYGGVIPFGITDAERDPFSVLSYYWSAAARERKIYEVYATPNVIRLGGPEARFGRACRFEYFAYVAKWLVPMLLLFPGGVYWLGDTRRTKASLPRRPSC